MDTTFDVHRQGWRLECGDKCVLRYCGRNIDSILVDISISGILVRCDDQAIEGIHVGDSCGVYLCGDPQVCTSEVSCLVVRKDSDRIGLQFPVGD